MCTAGARLVTTTFPCSSRILPVSSPSRSCRYPKRGCVQAKQVLFPHRVYHASLSAGSASQTRVAQFIAVCRRSKRWPWAREGLEEARVFAGDEPCNGEEIRRAPARFYALQSVIN